MAKEPKRFIEIAQEGGFLNATRTVFVDRETRVQYLFVQSGYGGGLSVMLDRDGRPLLYSGQFED